MWLVTSCCYTTNFCFVQVLNKFKEIWRELLDELVWEFQYQIEFEMDVHHVLVGVVYNDPMIFFCSALA